MTAETGGISAVRNVAPHISIWAKAGWILAVLAVLAGGYVLYRHQARVVRGQVEERLAAIAALKARQVAAWRHDQWVDAGLVAGNPFLGTGLSDLENTPNATAAILEPFFEQVQQEHDYADILIVADDGTVHFSLGGATTLPTAFQRAVAEALRERTRVVVDLAKTAEVAGHAFAMVAPLDAGAAGEDATPRGALVLINDAAHFLYPLLGSWPTPSKTAETFLVCREDDSVLVLNELRHHEGAALELRFPLTDTDKPMVQAVLGREGVVRGRDYRGKAVLAAIVPVPDSPWYIVSKVDSDEAIAGWYVQALLLLALLGAMLAALAAAAYVLWQQRQRTHLQALYRTEAQRRETAERYGVILRSIGDAVIVTDGQGNAELLNSAAEAMTGWTDAEARGRPLDEIFHIVNERTRESVESPVARVIREGTVVGLANHTLLIARDGAERPIADSGAPVRDQTGTLTGIVLVFQDQTEQYAFQQALSASEEKHRTLIENAPDAIFIQTGGCFAYANPACLRLFDAGDPGELVGQPVLNRFHPSDREGVRARIRRLNEAREPVEQAEEQILTLAGNPVPVEASAVPLEFEGEPGALVFVRNIRARKWAEGTRDRLITAIEQAVEAVEITDTDSVIEYVNPAFERITGYSRAEALGQKTSILKSGEHDDAFYADLWKTITSGRVWQGQIVNRRKDGTLYTEETTISPVFDTAGLIINYVAVKHDITERKQLEQEQELLQKQMTQAQKMESVGRLAGGVAHDFNNVLQVMRGYGELLLEALPEDAESREFAVEIARGVERAENLTQQLLAFARKQTIRPRVLDLNETVENMLKMLRRLIGEDIDLAWLPARGLWPVKLDPAQVDQILANLCVNARDAIGGVGKITIETRNATFDEDYCAHHPGFMPGDFVMLAVSDDGCGMDRETRENIFEPFFTTKAQGEGTGLGLSTIYGIVKQNQGFVNVYSEPESGSTFRIYLSREAGAVLEAPAPKPRDAVAGHGETVLFVEDDSAILDLGPRMLESLGYSVRPAATPEEALDYARDPEHPIQLLITDVVMPAMNGRELAAQLSTLSPGLKVLFMSGYTADVIAHRGVLEEGVNFIQKPFSLQDLAAKVREILDGA